MRMERRLAEMKSGVPNWVATALAGEWAGNLGNDIMNLDRGIAKIKAANLTKYYKWWHVPRLGHMENPRLDGVFRIFGGQLNSASSLNIRARKILDVVCIINDWEIQAKCLSEVGVNWSSYPSLANLVSWFRNEIPDITTHTAHNKHKNVAHHQPRGTTTFVCKELAQYAKERTSNHRDLGDGVQNCSMLTPITNLGWCRHITLVDTNREETVRYTNSRFGIFRIMH
jgi:hypothetical protein